MPHLVLIIISNPIIMKEIQSNISPYLVILIIAILGLQSCDHDFMDKEYNQKQYVADKVYITSIPQDVFLKYNIEAGHKSWRIVQYPDFVEPAYKTGVSDETGIIKLFFSINDHQPLVYNQGQDHMLVVDVKGLGLLGIPLVYQLEGEVEGTVSLQPSSLQLTDNEEGSFDIIAQGEDINWEIIEYPDWLNFNSNITGYINAGNYNTVHFKVNADGLVTGDYSGAIKIKISQDAYLTMALTLKVTVTDGVQKLYTGACIGSGYIKASDLMFVVTKSPNKILLFKDEISEPDVIDLQRVPKSMALSEDEKTLAISYSNAEISTYNTPGFDKIKTYSMSVISGKMVFASNNYLYFMSESSNSSYEFLNSMNLTSGDVVRSNNSEGGYQYLRKIPGKNIIVTSKKGWSPEFITLYYNTDKGSVNDMNEYRVSPNGVWPSDNGERLLTGSRTIYKIPEFNVDNDYFMAEDMPVGGELEWPSSEKAIGMQSQSALGRIYCVTEKGSFDTSIGLHIFNSTTFAKEQSIDVTSENVDYNDYWVYRPTGVYPNTEGTKLWVVQSFPDHDDVAKSKWRSIRVDIP